MDLHKHQLYLLEQHSGSFKIWSAIIRINTVYVIGHRLYKLYPNQSNPTHKKVKKKNFFFCKLERFGIWIKHFFKIQIPYPWK